MRLSLAVLVSGSLLIAGCGGGEESTSKSSASSKATATPTETPTATATPAAGGPSKKAWRAKVVAICKRNQRTARKIAADAQAEGLQGKSLIKAVLTRSFPPTRRFLNQLGEVEAPEAIAEDYNFFVERLKQSLPLLKSLPKGLEDKRVLSVVQAEFKDVAADTRPFALEHGLKACLPDQS